MSLFDVLRYPVSDPPTAKELALLPDEIFLDWKQNSSWLYWPTDTRGDMAAWYRDGAYNTNPSKQRQHEYDIALLRKMIKDYDEPI